MNIKQCINELYSLKHIIRYNNLPRIQDESVAEHSFFVSLIVARLHTQYKFNLEKALLTAIVHDISEIWISDIPRNITIEFPKLKNLISDIEDNVVIEKFPEYFTLITEFNNASTVEGIIVKYADVLSILQYAKNEVLLGSNYYMPTVIKEAEKEIKKYEKKLKKYRR